MVQLNWSISRMVFYRPGAYKGKSTCRIELFGSGLMDIRDLYCFGRGNSIANRYRVGTPAGLFSIIQKSTVNRYRFQGTGALKNTRFIKDGQVIKL